MSTTGSGIRAGVAAALLPLVPLAVAAGTLYTRWPSLPERFPIHWGANGRPDGWAPRAPGTVLAPLLFGAVLTALFLLVSLLPRSGRGGDTPGMAARRQAVLQISRRCSLAAAWMVSLLLSAVALIPVLSLALGPGGTLAVILTVAFGGILVLLGIVLAGLARLPRPPHAAGAACDERWKGGFYVDPDDPSIWVEKRFGIGYTLNLGRPAGRLLLVALLLLPLLLVGLTILYAR